MRALFDVNLMLALFQPHHVHHQAAQAWWGSNQTYGWASCPLTQNGFIRIAPQLKYAEQLSISAAADLLAEQTERTDHDFWPDDVSLVDTKIFDHGRILGPKQITDVFLLGLAVKHGGRLATFDGAIPLRAVKSAEPKHLAVVPRV